MLTVTEATAVNRLVNYLAPGGADVGRSMESEAKDALALLADAANKKLAAGVTGATVREHWQHPTFPGECTCDDVRGCTVCFDEAEEYIGQTVRDDLDRVWTVTHTGEKDGFPTIGGDQYWARPDDVEILEEGGPEGSYNAIVGGPS